MTDRAKNVMFTVKRFNPTENKVWDDNYNFMVTPGISVLDALNYIKENLDVTLSFRSSCRNSICGSCAVMVNGVSVLACKTKVLLFGEKITIKPLMNLPVVKDLVVDIRPFFERLDAIANYLDPVLSSYMSDSVAEIDDQTFKKIEKAAGCIFCGCCFSDCTVVPRQDDFLGPHVFTKAERFAIDPRDRRVDKRLSAVREGRIWSCDRCNYCTERCPKDVDPYDRIEELRIRLGKLSDNNDIGSRKNLAVKKDVLTKGQINEMMLAVRTQGLDSFHLYDLAIILLKKRKLPLRGEKITRIEELRALTKGDDK